MAKDQKSAAPKGGRPKRAKVTAKESLRRVGEFAKRKERIVAAVRKGKNRSVSA
jgi:hypothetical protein